LEQVSSTLDDTIKQFKIKADPPLIHLGNSTGNLRLVKHQ
jgi:hypothetical protein